jgi:hypothetical protein
MSFMTLVALTGLVGIAIYLSWAIVAVVAVNRLRANEPTLYAELGSPSGSKVLWRPFGSPELDPLIIHHRFRRVDIHDQSLRRLLELAYWVRWSLLISVVAFAFALLGTTLDRNAP